MNRSRHLSYKYNMGNALQFLIEMCIILNIIIIMAYISILQI